MTAGNSTETKETTYFSHYVSFSSLTLKSNEYISIRFLPWLAHTSLVLKGLYTFLFLFHFFPHCTHVAHDEPEKYVSKTCVCTPLAYLVSFQARRASLRLRYSRKLLHTKYAPSCLSNFFILLQTSHLPQKGFAQPPENGH